MAEPLFARKSLYILRENIRTLLHDRKQEQKELAEHCGHDKSWMNKFLNEGRGIRVGDFDKIASFFGIEPYQLFQPGISSLTERRTNTDRRVGRERRIGIQGRRLAGLRTELNKLPGVSSHGPSQLAPHLQTLPEPLQRILAAFARDIHAQIAGGQAATARVDRSDHPSRRRSVRRSTPKPKPDTE